MQDKSKKKETGNRNFIIAQVIIAILALAFLYSVIELGNKNATISSLQATISSLESQLNSCNSQASSQVSDLQNKISSLQSQLNSCNSLVSSLRSQIDSLNDIIALNKYTVLVDRQTINQPAGYWNTWTFSLNYPGYLIVRVESSTTDKTYVRVIYNAYGVNYDTSINVGTSGTAVFPILPSTNIIVGVGNSNIINGASEVVTIEYHY
jgi:cell division protein FtsB